MERGGRSRGDRESSALKAAIVVIGGLALSWITMETAFKPFLDRMRGAIDRSDPNRDPDDSDNNNEGDGADVRVGSDNGEHSD